MIDKIAVKDIAIAKKGNRQAIDQAKLVELGASLKEHGQLNPIIVQVSAGKKKYELIAGERRIRAAQEIGWDKLDATVLLNVSAAEAKAIRLTENLQREDLTPWEEAEQLQELHDLTPGVRVEDLAAKVGRGPQWVAQRLAIGKLIPALRALVIEQNWPLSHLPYLARVPIEGQADVLAMIDAEQNNDYDNDWTDSTPKDNAGLGWRIERRAPTLRVLLDRLSELEHSLKKTGWKLDDAELVPAAGACNSCPKRSGAQELLFAELAETKDDRCLDPACWQTKEAALVAVQFEKLKAKGADPILVSDKSGSRNDEDNSVLREKIGNEVQIESSRSYEKCKKTDPEARASIVVNGAKAGTVEYVKPHSWSEKAKANKSRPIDQDTGKSKPPSTKERLKTLKIKRQCRAVELWVERLEKLEPPHAGVLDVLLIILGTSTKHEHRNPAHWRELAAVHPGEVASLAWAQLWPVFESRLKRFGAMEDQVTKLWSEAESQAGAINYTAEWRACWTDAVAEIKMPKSLAAEGVEDPEADTGAKPKAKATEPAALPVIQDFAGLMCLARNADAGRQIIKDFEDAVNAEEVRALTKPTVGQVGPTCYVGYSVLNVKATQRIAKKSARCKALVDQWPEMAKAWQNLLAQEEKFHGRTEIPE